MKAGKLMAAAGLLALALAVSGCQDGGMISLFPKADKPIPYELTKKMKELDMTASSPIMIRIFKEEDALEVWKETRAGTYDLLETYEICKWSGKLGPKFKEGDRQAPEGFYTVNPYQMNPKSDYYLSFNMGFPNSYDRANGRTGSHLMVHGACSSAGCYSMTDERIGEIYALAREAFKGGQTDFQIQAFPFRMTPENMAEHRDNPNFEFWKMLKEGSDHFEITKRPPKVDVCDRQYVFNRIAEDEKAFKPTGACPETTTPDSLSLAYLQKVSKDEEIFAEVLKRKAFRDLFSGKASVANAAPAMSGPSAALSTEIAATGGEAPATTEAGFVVPVPEPSPLQPPAVRQQPEPRRNWLQRLFAHRE
ncbi:MAG: L,D-transpeptidase family protein [Pseudomonadota bacterium]|nr:L,D-transpeptidase family protein [Pseudomonadota bacterium]